MSTQRLSPNSTAYLTSQERYQNYTQKADLIIPNTTNFTVDVTPTVSTFGDGKFALGGSLTVGGTPAANYVIGTMPTYIVPVRDTFIPVTVLRAGVAVLNSVKVNCEGNSVASVAVTAAGSYATLPAVAAGSPGTGAILTPTMSAISATVAAAGTGYVPTNTITTTGSTGTQPIFTVATTKVVSATVAAGGTGGTPGTQTVTGTTGTGTQFEASVTVDGGGAISAVLSISVAGSYTVNPTTIASEPVTGASLTGAQLSVVMGVDTVTPSTPGACTALAASPVAQGSTSGSGTGATLTVLWGLLSIAVTSQGTNYSEASTVTVTGGGSTGGGAATITLDSLINLQLVNAPTAGDILYLDGVEFLAQPYY